MTDTRLITELEGRLVNAWPAFEVQIAGGWLLRFAQGYSVRANAAIPIVPGATLDDALIDHIAAQFAAQNIRPTFRLTGLEAPDADARLSARGFAAAEPTCVLVGDLAGTFAPDPAVTSAPAACGRWVRETAASYGGDKADDAILLGMLARIRQPAAFASLACGGRNAAWGLAVAERGFVGLYDIVVAADRRRSGLARRVVTSLLAWGRGQGATRAYLQVQNDNHAARALYASLGFEPAYRPTHRVKPPPTA